MRFTLRRLRKSKGSSLTSIGLLALGIGSATVIFSVADAYVFRPMFPDQEKLHVIWPEYPTGQRSEISYPDFIDWKSELESFSDLAVMWASTLNFVVRGVDVDSMAPLLRAEILRIDPAVVVEGLTTLEAIVDRQYRPWRFNAELFSVLGVTAVALASVGLFGLLAIAVKERTREIAIRAAVGATRSNLRAMFVLRGMVLAAAGIALGLAGSLVLARSIRSLLYGVGPVDATTLGFVAAIVLSTALLASFVPAERAARISPARALRYE